MTSVYLPETPEEIAKRQDMTNSYKPSDIPLDEATAKKYKKTYGSKLWRLDNLYYIRDKNNVLKVLKLNHSQRKLLSKRHNRKITLKSRQQGISTLYLAYALDDCLFKPGHQAGIQSYGQDESDKLAARARLMWDMLDDKVKAMLNIRIVADNAKGMTFSNGSILKIGNFRGDTLQFLHVSELGRIAVNQPEKAQELKTGAFQSVGKDQKISIESTAKGKVGLFYEMWHKAISHIGPLGPFDFEPVFLSWVEDPDCEIDMPQEISPAMHEYFLKIEEELGTVLRDTQKWWYVAKERELTEDMKQEYPSTPEEAFEQSIGGVYYKEEYKTLQLRTGLYDPALLVHSVFDFGVADDFIVIFFQKHADDSVKILKWYGNSGVGIDHYVEVYNGLHDALGWNFGKTYVPHDASVREWIAGGKTRESALREAGFNIVRVPKTSLAEGIAATRPFLRVVEIEDDCVEIVEAIQHYRKKYDRALGIHLDAPVHDKYSHTADCIRYLAVGNKYFPIDRIYVIDKTRPKLRNRHRGSYDI
ncbi:MAG: hypothetical protein RBT33_00755 [Candidatus Dojkabacteria bacterium]|jgi:hypothetical protein|nr:hypothetical protein [Candidatus Dojkabacteria bacterium]